ncbi:Cytochrome P450 monooxygenase alnD [Cladobotryum mycophilum]|uniref:Cytochrome P450 monooxygenase alnD n=1 Tax=Cladobotryum mycophilum TaxID=491253 RepID=A0ABR0SBN0_9HYPO
MASQTFYLLGETPSAAREIDVSDLTDLSDVQHLIASHFAIVDPNGIGFISQNRELTSAAEVIAAEGPLSISIDGKPVRDVPGPTGLPYIGNYLEVFPDHLGNHQRLFDKYGPLFRTTNMGAQIYQTNSPQLANIVFSESDFFTKHIIPGHPLHPIKTLGPKAVRHYAPTMQLTVEDSFKVFDKLDEDGEAWNVYQYMLKMGSQAVGKLVLGMDFEHFTAPDAPLHAMVIGIAENLELNKRISSMGSWYAKMPFGDPQRLRENTARVADLLADSISKAARGVEDLELQEAALQAENLVDYCLRATDNKGNKLPVEQFAPALVVATGAGFTTTSSLLSWLIYGLVTYEGMQDRLLQELIDNDWDENTQVTADLTNKLAFLDKYVKETQRRHNPSYQPCRTAKADMILPGGYRMPKDSLVIPALHHIHNNAALWDNPAKFDPDRWDTERVKNRPAGSYVPFAAGPRGCIGFNFALQEVKVFLPKLVYRYKFSLVQDGPIEYDPYFQLIRPNNLYVRAEKRLRWPPRSE